MFVPSLSVEHLFGADLAISFIHAFRIQSKFVASFDLRRVAEILLRLYTYSFMYFAQARESCACYQTGAVGFEVCDRAECKPVSVQFMFS